MTVNQLYKTLGKLIEQGHKRTHVAVDKPTFTHNCENDGCVILNVERCDVELVLQDDGDGGIAMNQDGTERSRWTVVLRGDNYPLHVPAH